MRRRRLLWLAGSCVPIGTAMQRAALAEPPPRRIAITARKFSFSENEVLARAGESIVFEVTSVDFMHGFALPQLQARVDAPPGRTVSLALASLRAGRYTFLCDNFCGEGHDRMTGALIVS